MNASGSKTITVSRFIHNGDNRLKISFAYDEQMKEIIKKIEGVHWSQSGRCWHLPDSRESVDKLFSAFRGIAWIDLRSLKEKKKTVERPKNKSHTSIAQNVTQEDSILIDRFQKYLEVKRYGESTVRTYTQMIKTFAGYLAGRGLENADIDDIEAFNYDVVLGEGYSVNFQRQFISAAKHFYGGVIRQKIDIEELTRPSPERLLPIVLSKEEVLRIISAITNLKHRTIISLMYSSGLRIGEVVRLKVEDIDMDRLMIRVEQSKGKKDRYVVLSKLFLILLKNYITEYRPDPYLFEGFGGGPYSKGSIRSILDRAVKSAGIKKRVTPHTLRHSFATHLLEQGVDLRYVQALLGHARPETTMIYTHVTNRMISSIESPFDRLMGDPVSWLKEMDGKGGPRGRLED